MNILGYYGIFLGLKAKNEASMLKRFDSEAYAGLQLITIEVPLTIPYATNMDFQRVDGKFIHNGEVYRLVKQKISTDKLTVICVKDTKDEKLNKAISAFVSTFSDEDAKGQTSGRFVFSFIKDYLPQPFAIKTISGGWVKEVLHGPFNTSLLAITSDTIVQPPEFS
jgi:hypothetical protein